MSTGATEKSLNSKGTVFINFVLTPIKDTKDLKLCSGIESVYLPDMVGVQSEVNCLIFYCVQRSQSPHLCWKWVECNSGMIED